MEIKKELLEWLFSDKTGVSSKTLCAHMLGIEYPGAFYPCDKWDRARCIKLLKVMPEWVERLDEMEESGNVTERIIISSAGATVAKDNVWKEAIKLIKEEGNF